MGIVLCVVGIFIYFFYDYDYEGYGVVGNVEELYKLSVYVYYY